MKRLLAVFVFITVLFCACSKQETTNPNGTSPEPSQTEAVTAEVSPSVETVSASVREKSVKEGLKADDGTVVLDVSCVIPQLYNTDDAGEIINEYYNNQISKQLDYARNELFPSALQGYEYQKENGIEFSPYKCSQSYTVMYNKDGMLSILRKYEDFSGASDGGNAIVAETFNLTNGGLIIPSDLFTVSEEEYTKRIEQEIIKLIDEAGTREQYYSDLDNLVAERYNKDYFYIKDGYYCVFFQVYEIAGEEMGTPCFEIPLERLEDIWKN